MPSFSQTQDGVVNAVEAVLLGGLDGNIADIAAVTGVALTITYTTDDPSITADGSVTIVDGDIPTDAEELEMMEEMVAEVNASIVDYALLRTKINSVVNNNIYDQTALGALTQKVVVSATDLFTIAYTTDDPSITRDNAIVIADGDITTDLELNEFFEEVSESLGLINTDIAMLHEYVNRHIGQRSFSSPPLGGVTALVSTATQVAITYTTDDPSFTPNNTITITDGDTIDSDERNQIIEEVQDELTKLRADVLDAHAQLVAYVALVGIS